MKKSDFKISLIIFGIYLLSSFLPIIQILIGYLNGGVISLIAGITSIDASKIAIPLNLILSIYFLYSYLKAKELKSQIISATIASFFISCLVLFTFEDYLINTKYYWLQFLSGAVLIGISLISIDFIRQIKKLNISTDK